MRKEKVRQIKAREAGSQAIEMEIEYPEYPQECKTLDIMREKYADAFQFFYDTDNKE